MNEEQKATFLAECSRRYQAGQPEWRITMWAIRHGCARGLQEAAQDIRVWVIYAAAIWAFVIYRLVEEANR